MKEEEHFEDQDVDDKNRNPDFNEIWLDIFVCIYLTQDIEKCVGCCVHGIEHSGSIKMQEIFSLTDEIVGS